MESVIAKKSEVRTSNSSGNLEKQNVEEVGEGNQFLKSLERISGEVNFLRRIGAGLGNELELRAEMEKYKKAFFEMRRKVKKYELVLPMYKLEIKSLKNELEREKRKKILAVQTPSNGDKRATFRETTALKIDQRRRKRSRSFRLRSPLAGMSPLSPTNDGANIFTAALARKIDYDSDK